MRLRMPLDQHFLTVAFAAGMVTLKITNWDYLLAHPEIEAGRVVGINYAVALFWGAVLWVPFYGLYTLVRAGFMLGWRAIGR
jgi:hypothetical protein